MIAKEILALQRKQPFTGIRIHISDGQAYEVLHPEMMMVTRTNKVDLEIEVHPVVGNRFLKI